MDSLGFVLREVDEIDSIFLTVQCSFLSSLFAVVYNDLVVGAKGTQLVIILVDWVNFLHCYFHLDVMRLVPSGEKCMLVILSLFSLYTFATRIDLLCHYYHYQYIQLSLIHI